MWVCFFVSVCVVVSRCMCVRSHVYAETSLADLSQSCRSQLNLSRPVVWSSPSDLVENDQDVQEEGVCWSCQSWGRRVLKYIYVCTYTYGYISGYVLDSVYFYTHFEHTYRWSSRAAPWLAERTWKSWRRMFHNACKSGVRICIVSIHACIHSLSRTHAQVWYTSMHRCTACRAHRLSSWRRPIIRNRAPQRALADIYIRKRDIYTHIFLRETPAREREKIWVYNYTAFHSADLTQHQTAQWGGGDVALPTQSRDQR